MTNQNPEQIARDHIDEQLTACLEAKRETLVAFTLMPIEKVKK